MEPRPLCLLGRRCAGWVLCWVGAVPLSYVLSPLLTFYFETNFHYIVLASLELTTEPKDVGQTNTERGLWRD